MTRETVSLTLPLDLAVQIDEMSKEIGKSPAAVVASAVSCLAILRWTVINFGGAFPSGRIPMDSIDD